MTPDAVAVTRENAERNGLAARVEASETPVGEVRGMAEMPYLPITPALVAAVHDATGVWFDEFPLTQEGLLQGLRKISSTV